MKAPFSNYLDSLVPGLRKLIEILEQDFDYVSVLSTDSKGLAVRISQHSKSVGNQTMTTERGTVVHHHHNQDIEYFHHHRKFCHTALYSVPFSLFLVFGKH